MIRVTLKNTFLSVEENANSFDTSALASPCSKRSRSEEPHCKFQLCQVGNATEVQLEALNKIIDSPRILPSVSPVAIASDSVCVDELRSLKQKLVEACQSKVEGQPGRPLGKMGAIMSSSSVSTMAPSDDIEEDRLAMRQVLSCNSVCTMASEDEDVEFDLTMEVIGEPQQRTKVPLPPKNLPKESRHCNVPKTLNLAVEYAQNDRDKQVTTLMIRNIPNRYSQRELINELKSLGFGGTFDFLYIPLDLGTMSNVGYAFVNFIDHVWAEKCMEVFHNYRFRRHRQAGKVAAVSVAHIQGLDGNLRHYEKSAVNTARLKQRRPVIMANISCALTTSVCD